MKQPNILLITTDQQHWNTLGTVNPNIRTPALDRLASEGTRFSRAYCSNPVCSPSRSTMLTGLYPAWHHCWNIGVKLPEDVPTINDSLKEHGFRTTLVGKAHFQPTKSVPGCESIEAHPFLRDLDFWRNFHGPWYGFSHIEYGRMHGDEHLVGGHYAVWMEENGLDNWAEFFGQWPLPDKDSRTDRMHSWNLPERYHHTHWVGERTIANIEDAVSSDEPFFLWSSFFDPHVPYLVPEPWASMYDPQKMPIPEYSPEEFDKMPPYYRETGKDNPDFSKWRSKEIGSYGLRRHRRKEEDLRKDIAVYYGMVSFIDHEVGKILNALDRLGIAENTLVLFSTDHGHFYGQHGLLDKGPFHYDDVLRIPMLARLPGRIPAGVVSPSLQSQVDWAPTFLAAADIEIPGIMQGTNQLPCWEGRTEKVRDHVIVENRQHPEKLALRTLVTESHKITVFGNNDFGELFDLEQDPGETDNLWDSPLAQPLKGKLMHKFLQAEMTREPIRMPRICGA